jgi:stage V sporulation protein SpoVS
MRLLDEQSNTPACPRLHRRPLPGRHLRGTAQERKEVILTTQRALEQQALESWQLQKQAQIEELRRRGEPLGAIASALASPETAERIAVLEAAMNGQMSALDAARLNMQRAGHDLSLLEGLRSVGADFTGGEMPLAVEAATELLAPLVAGRRN